MANIDNGHVSERKKATRPASPQKAGKKPGRGNGEGSRATQFKIGNNGNPTGKPKGLRNAVSRDFLTDVITVWNEANEKGNKTGLDALRDLAKTRPGQFVAAVGNLVPREFALDDETQEGFAAVWAALAKASASKDD
jgi:hypothetical protein